MDKGYVLSFYEIPNPASKRRVRSARVFANKADAEKYIKETFPTKSDRKLFLPKVVKATKSELREASNSSFIDMKYFSTRWYGR